MKKKLCLIVALIFAAGIIGLLTYYVHWIFGVLGVIGAIGILVLWKNSKKVAAKLIDKEKPTSYFTDLMKRNMNGIVVGSTKAWKYVKVPKKKRIYSALSYKSTSPMEFNILKTYFSHVKENGVVYFIYDYFDGMDKKKVTFMDYKLIHPHVFLYLGVNPKKCKKNNSFLFKYVVNYMMRKFKVYKYNTWKYSQGTDKVEQAKVEKVCYFMNDLIKFCHERRLQIKIVLLDSLPKANETNRKVQEYVAANYGENICIPVKSAKELNKVFSL